MAMSDSFSYRLVKTALIILNSLVVIGFSLSLLLVGHHFDPHLVIFVLIIESNFVAAIVGTVKESRPLVMFTGSVTLIMLLMAAFTRNDRMHTERNQNTTFTLLYFLAIVILSYSFSAMLKERQLRGPGGHRSAAIGGARSPTTAANDTPFAAVIVYHSPAPNGMQVNLPMEGSSAIADPQANGSFKDPPPPYDDCPPPKYEEVINNSK